MNGEELVGSTTDISEALVNECGGISRQWLMNGEELVGSTTDISEALVNEWGGISRQYHRYR